MVLNFNDRTYFIDNILTIKFLFTINSLKKKKTISSKHYLLFLSLKKNSFHFMVLKSLFLLSFQ